MVGKCRLNRRRRSARLAPALPRVTTRAESPFRVSPVALRVDASDARDLNQEILDEEVLNQERTPASSIGRRSDCQSRKTPPTRKTKSASHTPAAGDSRPCVAKETPIRETE